MKNFFTLLFVFCFYLGASAQIDFNVSNLDDATLSADQTFGDVTVYAGSSTVVIEPNNKSYDGVDYTKRLKLGGSGSWIDPTTPEYRVISFAVSGDTDINLICMSSNSTSSRIMNVYAGDNTNTVQVFDNVIGSALSGYSFTYTGPATTIYVESTSGGINFYAIKTSVATDIDDLNVSKKVVKTQFYSINGVAVSDSYASLPKGLFIKQEVYEDGTSKASKVRKTSAW